MNSQLGSMLWVCLLFLGAEISAPAAAVPKGPPSSPAVPQARRGLVPAIYFGMHIHRAVARPGDLTFTEWPAVSFGSWRLWDAGVAWPSLEPSNGTWDFSVLDQQVALAERAHVEVLLPLGLSPPWASARPREASAYRPGNSSEPVDLEFWKRYVATVASRYRGHIQAYEIWNEPNLTRFYSGSAETMLRLAALAYRQIKSLDPEALVVSPSATGAAGLAWLESYLERGGGRWADVIGYHFYVGQNQSPEEMAGLIQQVRAILDRHGLSGKPIWNTETGWRIAGEQEPPAAWKSPLRGNGLGSRRGAAYVARALVLGWAGGLDRFYWYSWDHYSMGLVEPDGKSLKPAGKAYGIVHEWLVGAKVDSVVENPDGVWTVAIERPGGGEAEIVWKPSGVTTYRIPPTWEGATAWDLAGGRVDLPKGNCTGDFEVGESPQLIERMGSP
jgi:hypothetical protein